MLTGSIYILIDPFTNHPRYVGQTIRKPSERYNGHICDGSLKRQKTYNVNWIKKLKSLNSKPIMEVIDSVPENELNFWEAHYISLYKSWGFKLTNGTTGGDACKATEATKLKMKASSGNTRKRMLLNNPAFKKIKPILQYDLKGNFIKEWTSSSEAEKELGYLRECVFRACQKESKRYKNSLWRFKTEDFKLKITPIKNTKKNGYKRPIIQFDLNNNFIKEWSSIKEAQLNIRNNTIGSISPCVRGIYKQAYGFIWKYKE